MASLKTITQFKSRLAGGGARPNLFEVNILMTSNLHIDWDNETFQFLMQSNSNASIFHHPCRNSF